MPRISHACACWSRISTCQSPIISTNHVRNNTFYIYLPLLIEGCVGTSGNLGFHNHILHVARNDQYVLTSILTHKTLGVNHKSASNHKISAVLDITSCSSKEDIQNCSELSAEAETTSHAALHSVYLTQCWYRFVSISRLPHSFDPALQLFLNLLLCV